MEGSAHLVPLPTGNLQFFPHAVAQIAAVLSAAGRTVISGGYDGIVLHDNSAVTAAKAGASFRYGLRNIQIIVFL
jgi:hypothetical protein